MKIYITNKLENLGILYNIWVFCIWFVILVYTCTLINLDVFSLITSIKNKLYFMYFNNLLTVT